MEKQGFLWLSLFILISCLCAAAHLCDIPPKYWCDTPQIAEKCQVYDSCAKYVWNQGNDVSSVQPVHLSLYYESLCPGCRAFITGQITRAVKAFGNSQPGSVMQVNLFPYGNARETYNDQTHSWVFDCQHGEQECIGNVIETCSMHLLRNFTSYWPFILCIESGSDHLTMDHVAQQCATSLGINYSPIQACAQGALGNQLEHKIAEATDNLQPPHKYAPWIVVNGIHTEEIQSAAQMDLVKFICDTYKGPTPPACAGNNAVLSRSMRMD